MPASSVVSVEESCEGIKAEYLDMPGLCLTKSQIERRWALDRVTSEAVLSKLVATGFLTKSAVGYVLSRNTLMGLRRESAARADVHGFRSRNARKG